MKKVSSLNNLKALAFRKNGDFVDFFMLLGGGIAKSSKRISYRPNEIMQWHIINEIDDSFEELTDEDLATKTMIVEAIQKGAFYMYTDF